MGFSFPICDDNYAHPYSTPGRLFPESSLHLYPFNPTIHPLKDLFQLSAQIYHNYILSHLYTCRILQSFSIALLNLLCDQVGTGQFLPPECKCLEDTLSLCSHLLSLRSSRGFGTTKVFSKHLLSKCEYREAFQLCQIPKEKS